MNQEEPKYVKINDQEAGEVLKMVDTSLRAHGLQALDMAIYWRQKFSAFQQATESKPEANGKPEKKKQNASRAGQ